MRLNAICLALILLAGPPAAEAQPAAKIPRLCYLTLDPGTLHSTRFASFFEALRALGYVDGQTITIDYLSAHGQHGRFPALAADCVRLRADIIVASTTPAAHAAKNATSTIPIVMQALGDPVGTGLVRSLAQPGGNITGMTFMTTGLAAKRLELLKEAVPKISRVLVLADLADPIALPQVRELQKAAPSLGIKVHVRDIRTVEDLPVAFDTGAREGAEALFTTTESIFFIHRDRLIQLANKYKLPSSHGVRALAVAGGLMAYYPRPEVLFGRAADYVDRILKGAKPADLPVQQPSHFELAVNLKTAKELGPDDSAVAAAPGGLRDRSMTNRQFFRPQVLSLCSRRDLHTISQRPKRHWRDVEGRGVEHHVPAGRWFAFARRGR